MAFSNDITIMGGCGHVGLPLGMAFATKGLRVALYDVDARAVARINAGEMPFREDGADELLPELVAGGHLEATVDRDALGSAENVVVVVGTPIDRYLSPTINAVPEAVSDVSDALVDGQLLVLRSTVYPGVTALVERHVGTLARDLDVAFCPERIAEGHALRELKSLPQIVSARDPRVTARAGRLFRHLTDEIVELAPEEAELAKLFTNTWRYIKFATANQLFTMANDFGLDYERIRGAITHHYPRAADLPSAGFSAGPCLFKDTMQLAAFNGNNFALGNAAMLVNEGLPLYTVQLMERRFDLSQMTVGILGMAFKAGSDDIRSSLSYKLKRLLRLKAKLVLCHDPHVSVDPELVSMNRVTGESDLIIIATPHREYADLSVDVPVIDIQNLLGAGVLV